MGHECARQQPHEPWHVGKQYPAPGGGLVRNCLARFHFLYCYEYERRRDRPRACGHFRREYGVCRSHGNVPYWFRAYRDFRERQAERCGRGRPRQRQAFCARKHHETRCVHPARECNGFRCREAARRPSYFGSTHRGWRRQAHRIRLGRRRGSLPLEAPQHLYRPCGAHYAH